jgi:hypothetical protein
MQSKALYPIIALVTWAVLLILFQVLAFRLDLEVFFVLWLIGVLVVAEMVDATTVQPRQIRYLKYFIAVQVVIFGAIVAEKVLEILNS